MENERRPDFLNTEGESSGPNPEKLGSGFISGSIEARLQPEGGRDLATYEKYLGVDRTEFEGKAILDLGTGPQAKFLEELQLAGIHAQVVGVSPDFENQVYQKKVRKASPDSALVAGLGQEMPFRDESFDEVVGVHVWEHTINKFRPVSDAFLLMIREISRVLRPGGRAILAPVHNIEGYDFVSSPLLDKETREALERYHVHIHKGDFPQELELGAKVDPDRGLHWLNYRLIMEKEAPEELQA